MAYMPNPEFAALFRVYTSDPDSIGMHLARNMHAQRPAAPMLVTTGSDLALFGGQGRAPLVESFRRKTRGFIELTAVSHLPPALAYLARMRQLDPDSPVWRADARRLLHHTQQVRQANSVALWRDHAGVPSFAGHEPRIAAMVEYTCARTAACLEAALADPAVLEPERLRTGYLEGGDPATPVPMNDVMFATFALAFMDIVARITAWLRAQELDWGQLMVLVSGRSGRPTAGLAWHSNNMCHLIWAASDGRLDPEHLYVAPHAPSFEVGDGMDLDELARRETAYRELWLNTRASVEVARQMFAAPGAGIAGTGGAVPAPSMSDMPALRGLDDRASIKARLRKIMEDPTQLLSNCVADILIEQLRANGNRPELLEIPGFTNIDYETLVG